MRRWEAMLKWFIIRFFLVRRRREIHSIHFILKFKVIYQFRWLSSTELMLKNFFRSFDSFVVVVAAAFFITFIFLSLVNDLWRACVFLFLYCVVVVCFFFSILSPIFVKNIQYFYQPVVAFWHILVFGKSFVFACWLEKWLYNIEHQCTNVIDSTIGGASSIQWASSVENKINVQIQTLKIQYFSLFFSYSKFLLLQSCTLCNFFFKFFLLPVALYVDFVTFFSCKPILSMFIS